MKIAIVIGHNERAQGAVRVTDGRTEYDWNGELAEMIRAHDPAAVKIFRRKAGGGYSAEIDRVYQEVDVWGADCSIELHFNAAGSRSAVGGLTISSGTSGSMGLAKAVREAAASALGNKDRGVIVRGRHERGGRSLWQGRAPAVMTEPYFGSNADECAAADRHMDELAEAYYRAAVSFLGGKPKARPVPAPSSGAAGILPVNPPRYPGPFAPNKDIDSFVTSGAEAAGGHFPSGADHLSAVSKIADDMDEITARLRAILKA